MMRLRAIQLSGFRAFSNETVFNLDADAIVVSGANGRGKTSLLDGVLWSITGQVPRLGKAGDVVSLYSKTDEARVRIDLSSGGAEGDLTIIRTCDRSGERRLRVLPEGGEPATGPEAESIIHRRLWPLALTSSMAAETITRTFTRCIYLEQDLIRQYLEADSDDERFRILSELMGVGRITELQQTISKQKRGWTKATTPLKEEAEDWRKQVQDIEKELDRLGEPTESEAPIPWDEWWGEVEAVIEIERTPLEELSQDAPVQLERALDQLEAQQRKMERRLARVRSLESELEGLPESSEATVEDVEKRLEGLESELAKTEAALSEAQEKARIERARLVAEKDRQEDLAALARIALRHLGETCPVCTQTHDDEHTRKHLRSLIESAPQDSGSNEGAESPLDLSERVTLLTERVEQARREKKEVERAQRRKAEVIEVMKEQLQELGYPGKMSDEDKISDWLKNESTAALQAGEQLSKLLDRGEDLSLLLAKHSEQARRKELEGQLQEKRTKYRQLISRLEKREETGETCERVVAALRDGEHSIMGKEIERLEPLLKQLYAKIDPHPTFQDIALAVTMYYGKGRLSTELLDAHLQENVAEPRKVLSSSQLNALAVCLFLAMNYGTVNLPLHTMLLDDPIQSLDDVNLLGVIDVLRRIRPRRQVIISTHDDGFARLLERKLRPMNDQQETLSIEFLDWSRHGPEVEERIISRQPDRLRVVA